MSAESTPRPTGGPGITRFAARDGHRLSYESSGATDGIPVLGLHDLLADRGQLRPLAATLPPERFRLTFPDARGHGASPMISGRAYPAADLVADALAVLDAEGLTSAHIAAVGWGAGIALGIALLAPERVASLVLAQPYLPMLANQEQCLQTLRQAADAAAKGQTDQALDLYLGMRLGPGWRDGLPKPRLGALRRAAGSLAPLLLGITSESSTDEMVSRLTIPAAILVPDHAAMSDRQMAEALAARMPKARLTTAPHDPGALDHGWAAALAAVIVAETRHPRTTEPGPR